MTRRRSKEFEPTIYKFQLSQTALQLFGKGATLPGSAQR
jgi:hypothetical protein